MRTPLKKVRSLTNPHLLWIFLFYLKIYYRPYKIYRSKLPHIYGNLGPHLFVIIFLCILLFYILDLNYHHFSSTYSYLSFLYHMNIWGCGWHTINMGDKFTNTKICLFKKKLGYPYLLIKYLHSLFSYCLDFEALHLHI